MKKAYKIDNKEIMKIYRSYKQCELGCYMSGKITYVSSLEKCVDLKLSRCISDAYRGNNIISAEKIITECFSQNEYDVFISHSRPDFLFARILKIYLEEKLSLRCFLDYDVWYNAYEIMKSIDYRFNRVKNTKSIFEYMGCRKSSVNVTLMLSTALTHMLEICPVVIFISSDNSISNLNGRPDKIDINDKTYSPWLYHEISMVNMMKRIQSRDSSLRKTGSFEIDYPLDLSQFENIDAEYLDDLKHKREQNPNINVLDIIING